MSANGLRFWNSSEKRLCRRFYTVDCDWGIYIWDDMWCGPEMHWSFCWKLLEPRLLHRCNSSGWLDSGVLFFRLRSLCLQKRIWQHSNFRCYTEVVKLSNRPRRFMRILLWKIGFVMSFDSPLDDFHSRISLPPEESTLYVMDAFSGACLSGNSLGLSITAFLFNS